MVNGVLYFTAGTRRAVVALDAGDRRDAVDAQPERRPARRGGAAAAVGPRPRVLDRRQGGAHPLRHARLSAGRARCQDRRPDPRLRQERHRRSEAWTTTRRWIWSPAKSACTPRRSSRRTSSSSAPRTADGGAPKSKTNEKGYVRGFDVRTGKRLWIFHTIPRPGEFGNDTWQNDSWSYTGNTGVWAQMTVDEELGHRLPAGRDADRRLLRRASARQRSVRREPRRGRSEDRQAEVALPARPSRHLGLGHPVRADPGRHHRQRQARSRRSRSRPSRAGSTCSIASPASRSGRSRSGRSRRATCRASGTRRRSRS